MKKEHLIQHIQEMSEEQINYLSDLLNFANSYDYQLKFKLCGISEEEKRKIDTATPEPYAKAIREIYPDFNNGNNVYNYNSNNYGEMLNINNLFVSNLKKVLKLKTL